MNLNIDIFFLVHKQNNNMDIEDLFTYKLGNKIKEKYNDDQYNKIELMIMDFISDYQSDENSYQLSSRFMTDMMKKYKVTPKKEEILYVYRKMVGQGKVKNNKLLENCFKKKDMRETSGVMVFAVLSSPYPETGVFIDKIHVDNNNKLSNSGTPIVIDKVGNIISMATESVTIDHMVNNNKTKTKQYKVGDNISHLINPLTGELRQSFSCPFDCYFCPSQPGMPKSYEDKEPAVSRSLRHGWNVGSAMRDRFEQYLANGMGVDKMEVIIKGGTWTSYNSYYRRKCCRDIFYTANTFWDDINNLREPLSLKEEQKINETAKSRIIGITIETRPDYITDENLIEFRECGITRVELGFQHTNNKILKKINRQHTVEDSAMGIAKLLSCGFKVDIHLMPGLPNTDYEMDKDMVNDVLTNIKYRADQLKWYPVVVTPYTVIKQWYDKNKYNPWVENIDQLVELTVYFKTIINPWNRTNRIQRDFTEKFVCGGSSKSNLGDMVSIELKKRKIQSWDIRDREIRNRKVDMSTIEMVVREYDSYSDGPNGEMVAKEIFISYEANDRNIILGFLRLRLDPNAGLDVFDELQNCAMIRELHVYGKMVSNSSSQQSNAQHLGLGSKLMNKAKEISTDRGYKRLSVIAGVGVRDYYRNKHNFYDGKYYLLCDL